MSNDERSSQSTWQRPKLWQIIVALIACSVVISYNVGFAKELKPLEQMQEIYHVYNDGNYVTTISDKALVDEVIQKKKNEAFAQYPDYNIKIGSDVTVHEELAFERALNEEEAIKKLEDALIVKAEALAITVNGEVATHVLNEQAYEDVKRAIFLKYVTAEQLAQFESGQTSDVLAPNEKVLQNIFFNEDVTVQHVHVAPSNIKGVDNAVRALLNGDLQVMPYTIQPNDTVESLANMLNVSTKHFYQMNGHISSYVLAHTKDVMLYMTGAHVSVQSIFNEQVTVKEPYKRIVEKDNSILKGENMRVQQGVEGVVNATYKVRKINGQIVGKSVAREEVIRDMQPEIIKEGTLVTVGYGTGDFAWPTVGGYISSKMGPRWGRQHQGIDIARPTHRDILASDGGVVTIAGAHSTYGNYVKIDHKNGYETLYAHLTSFTVRVGDKVTREQPIGTMGSTGRSTGMHLHFEVYKNGRIQNPLHYIEQ